MNDITQELVTRRALLGGAMAIGGLALTGCTSGSGANGGGSVSRTLNVGMPTDVLPPAIQRFNPSNRPLRRTVFDVLVNRKQDGSFTPSLATSWEWSADKTSLVLTLQDGVTFHSGRDFGPDDVVYSIKTAMAEGSGVQVAPMFKRASDVKKSGPSQVTVSFDDPFSSYLDALAMLPIIDSKTFADAKNGRKVVGTGPFAWKSWTPGSKLVLERNGSYWQEGKPYVDGVELRVIGQSQALLAAMQSDALDLGVRMLARDAATLKQDSKFTVDATPGYDTYVGISTQRKPMDDIRVRQAVAYSIDRKRIADQVYSGFAQPSAVLWDGQTPGVTDDMVQSYGYDIDKARSLLEEAGVVGTEVEFAPSPQDPSYAAAGDIVQYGLEQAGLKIKRVSITPADWPKRNQAYDLPAIWLSIIGLTVSGPVPTLLAANPLTADANTSHFTESTYQKDLGAVVSAASKDESEAALHELTSYMLEQAFHNSIVQAQVPIVSTKELTGVTTDATLSLNLTDAKLSG